MSRVWKQFLKNLAWPFGFAAYIIAVVTGASYADTLFPGGALVIAFLFIALPVLTILIRDMWRDAKQKVAEENRRLMQEIKGDTYDF